MEKIVFINARGERLCGILETSKHPQPAGPRRLALICHGWMGSKNYLFQAQLAKALPFDSFRFDFSGNGESEGFIQWGHFERDIEDIDAAVKLMRQERGYLLDTVIGHSRGALSVFKYVTLNPDGFRCLVNVAGRQIMGKLKASRLKELETKGYFEMEYNLRSGKRVVRATVEDVASGDNWQKPFVQNLPPSVRTLTIHGTEDTVNPLSEAVSFANFAPNHTLRLLVGADHNLRGFHNTVCSEILSWLQHPWETGILEADPHPGGLRRREDALSVPLRRVIPIKGMTNFRDAGGYPTFTRTGRVRSRYLFRSDLPYGLPEEGLEILVSLGIQRCFDLRSNPEIERMPVTDISCERSHTPVFPDQDFAPEALLERWSLFTQGAQGFGAAYMHILTHGDSAFSAIFRHILEDSRGERPILIHCTAGKDRTGVAIMLLLLTAGVEDEAIIWDYALTGDLYRPAKETIEKLMNAASNPFTDPEQIKEMLGAKAEYLRVALELFKARFGTIEKYWTKLGFSPEEIRNVRDHLQAPPVSLL